MSIPPALAPELQALLQARYGPEQREECAGWRGVFEEQEAAEGEDGGSVLVATRDIEACEVRALIWRRRSTRTSANAATLYVCIYVT